MLTFILLVLFVFERMAFRLDSRALLRCGANSSGRRRQAACTHRSFLKSTCSSSPGRKNGSTSRRGPSAEPASEVHQEPPFRLPLRPCTPSRCCFHSHCRPKQTNTCFHHDNVATECCCVLFCFLSYYPTVFGFARCRYYIAYSPQLLLGLKRTLKPLKEEKKSCWAALCSILKLLFLFFIFLTRDVGLSNVTFQTVAVKRRSCHGPRDLTCSPARRDKIDLDTLRVLTQLSSLSAVQAYIK